MKGSVLPAIANAPSDAIQGIGEGALNTVNTVSKGLNKIPGVGETLAPSAGINASEKIGTADNTTQKVGQGAEGIMEFITGDEALKGLSLAEKLGLAQKVAKLAEAHPWTGKLVKAGMDSLRQATVGAGQAAAHGASPTEAAKAGAETGAVGLGIGTAAEGVKALGTKAVEALTDTGGARKAVQENMGRVFGGRRKQSLRKKLLRAEKT
jgi:hypothetical protein